MGAKQCKFFTGRGVNVLEDAPIGDHVAKSEIAAKEEFANVSFVETTDNGAHTAVEDQGAKNEDDSKEEVAKVEGEKDTIDYGAKKGIEEQGAKNEVEIKESAASENGEKDTTDSGHTEVEEQGAKDELQPKEKLAIVEAERNTTDEGAVDRRRLTLDEDRELENLFEQYDVSNDGLMEQNEFFAFCNQLPRTCPWVAQLLHLKGSGSESSIIRPDALFRQFDTDGDGKIEIEELKNHISQAKKQETVVVIAASGRDDAKEQEISSKEAEIVETVVTTQAGTSAEDPKSE
jgi:hypothetical protein